MKQLGRILFFLVTILASFAELSVAKGLSNNKYSFLDNNNITQSKKREIASAESNESTNDEAPIKGSEPKMNPYYLNPNASNFSEQFGAATQAYQNKDYKEAERLFLELLKQEPQSPEILQNLGLIYYSLEDKGRALAYLRSLANIEPRNIEAYKTIDFVESKLINKDFEHDRSFLEDVNLMLLRWIKLPEFLILHFIALLVFGLWLIKRMALKKKLALQDEKILLFNPQIYAGLTLITILTCLAVLKISFSNTDKATIIAKNKLTIKSGPSENSADLYELFEGFEVNIESTFKDWAQITYQDQYTGWVKNSNLWKHIK